jgi:hypothetical protein
MSGGRDFEILGEWFESDYGDDQFSAVELEFLGELRSCARAADWSADPDDSMVLPVLADYRRELLAALYVVDPRTSESLFAAGVFFDGIRVVGDRMHDQMLTLEGGSKPALECSGTPRYLAQRTAGWFGKALTRRAVVH